MVGLAGSAISRGGARGAAVGTLDTDLSEVIEGSWNASASRSVVVHLSEINSGAALNT